MNYAVKIKLMIFVAIALVFPFLVFEVFAVFKLGFAEPYSYALFVPLVILSFFILQVAIGLSVVKGWASSGMPKNYVYLFFWIFSTALLFALPKAFGRGGV